MLYSTEEYDKTGSGPGGVEPIDLVLPVHNEEASIGATLSEFHEIANKKLGLSIRFIVCEDGSTDRSVQIVQELSNSIPILLLSAKQRKGYSRAVTDGLRESTAPLVGFVDSDGQCDPADILKFTAAIGKYDLVMGYRNPRADHWIRRVMSRSFGVVYSMLFTVPFRDPSCPYLLIRRQAIENIFRGNLGILKQGFWWEFSARAIAAGLTTIEVPVAHRIRTAGATQVYQPAKVARIAAEHLRGLFKLRKELRQLYPKS